MASFHCQLLLLQVPIVEVTARALLPSTSVITFTLGADKLGIFNMAVWDGMARKAMIK